MPFSYPSEVLHKAVGIGENGRHHVVWTRAGVTSIGVGDGVNLSFSKSKSDAFGMYVSAVFQEIIFCGKGFLAVCTGWHLRGEIGQRIK